MMIIKSAQIELKDVGPDMENAHSASLVRVLGMEVWVLLVQQRRQWIELAAVTVAMAAG